MMKIIDLLREIACYRSASFAPPALRAGTRGSLQGGGFVLLGLRWLGVIWIPVFEAFIIGLNNHPIFWCGLHVTVSCFTDLFHDIEL